MRDSLKLVGVGHCWYEDENGNRYNEVVKHNAVVTVGFDFVRKAITVSGETRPTAMEYVAIGSGDSQTLVSMTALESEVSRVKGTWVYDDDSKKFTITGVWERGAITQPVQEVGVFNALASGVMLDRLVYEKPIPAMGNMAFNAVVEFQLA